MNHTIIATAAAVAVSTGIQALACTSLIATPGATTDGSAMITYAADSHTLYGELYSTPAANHAPGENEKGLRLGFGPLSWRDSTAASHLFNCGQYERARTGYKREHLGGP